ncbi:MAG TPA: HlyD family efflux transporter periplasmic adaptor subunit [Actinocrinis sp.]|nr:HlyD family efflux transporter periplasmic adaptor subunit [Actinocrinis sp.]
MNAALASGEAGVGEIKEVRGPVKPAQLTAAAVVAALGVAAGLMTYHAIATPPPSYAGEVTPTNTYYLNFTTTGPVVTLTVHPGQTVKAGQVLATQDSTVPAANLAAAKAAVTADQALLSADEQPQVTGSEQAQDALDIQRAQAAVNSAQTAASLVQSNGVTVVGAQQAVINGDQQALDTDTAQYDQTCVSTSGAAAQATSAPSHPPAPQTPGSSPGPAVSTAPTAPSAPGTQLCQNLGSQVQRDSSALAQAKETLASIQTSEQTQQQQDTSDLSGSESALAAVQGLAASRSDAGTSASIALAQSQLATAQAQVAQDQLTLQQTSIVAPANGTVAETAGAVGAVDGPSGVHSFSGPAGQPGTGGGQSAGLQLFATPGSAGGPGTGADQYAALITVYSGALNVTAQVPESDMQGVKLGQSANLEIPAASLAIAGKISQIVTVPTTVSGSNYYDVTVALDSQPPALVAGMSASMTLP